jgi:hypothetical protein
MRSEYVLCKYETPHTLCRKIKEILCYTALIAMQLLLNCCWSLDAGTVIRVNFPVRFFYYYPTERWNNTGTKLGRSFQE